MKIGIIGCGQMGGGIAQRLANNYSLFLYDHHASSVKKLAEELGATPCKTPSELCKKADILFLAVKPQQLQQTAKEFAPFVQKHLLISILTGKSIETLKQQFPKASVIRMMTNLAAVFGQGVVILAEDSSLPQKLKKQTQAISQLLGSVYWFPESKIDALTSLIGSGPAFFYVMLEAMVDAGVHMGIKSQDSLELITQMISGSLTLLKEKNEHPGQLRWQISSPQGTTIAGIRALEECGVRAGIINAFIAAYERALEMKN